MILFSAVRSNLESNTGFLRDPQRMNVMLTRAKRGLVVFGDRETMSTEKEIWKRWFKWIDSKKAALTLERLDELLPIISERTQACKPASWHIWKDLFIFDKVQK